MEVIESITINIHDHDKNVTFEKIADKTEPNAMINPKGNINRINQEINELRSQSLGQLFGGAGKSR